MAKSEQRKVDTGIVQRGNTYRFTVSMGYDVNGKQIRKTTTFVPPAGLTQKKADKLAKIAEEKAAAEAAAKAAAEASAEPAAEATAETTAE